MTDPAAAARRRRGARFALASAVLLGSTPVFGKLALAAGLPPLAVVAGRTAGAAALLALAVLFIRRADFAIYPLGLAGCTLAGALNGLGSLFYYTGLARLDAGLAQMLFSFYPVFLALVLYLDGQRQTPITLLRLALTVPAILLLTRAGSGPVDLAAAGMLLLAGLLYALHIPINQRVLYEAPAPTVTLYTLLAMAAVVVPAYALLGPPVRQVQPQALAPLAALTLVTFGSRLALFAGVKRIGGMQAALLSLAELLVALALSHLWLGEALSPAQWLGGALLAAALLLAGADRHAPPAPRGRGWLHWLRAPSGAPLRPPASDSLPPAPSRSSPPDRPPRAPSRADG